LVEGGQAAERDAVPAVAVLQSRSRQGLRVLVDSAAQGLDEVPNQPIESQSLISERPDVISTGRLVFVGCMLGRQGSGPDAGTYAPARRVL
jgi:hypothetical protein